MTHSQSQEEGENKWDVAKCGDDKKDTRINDEVENYTYYVKVRKVRDQYHLSVCCMQPVNDSA